MDIEDFALGGSFLIIGGITIIALVILGIYATTVDINKNNNTNSYQKCICKKVEEWLYGIVY